MLDRGGEDLVIDPRAPPPAQFAEAFHQRFYLGLLQDIFAVLTDTLHSPGFKLQSQILAHMFLLVESKAISGARGGGGTLQPWRLLTRQSVRPLARLPAQRRCGMRRPCRPRTTART